MIDVEVVKQDMRSLYEAVGGENGDVLTIAVTYIERQQDGLPLVFALKYAPDMVWTKFIVEAMKLVPEYDIPDDGALLIGFGHTDSDSADIKYDKALRRYQDWHEVCND